MSDKRYTAQELREVVDMFNSPTNPIAVCFCDKDGWHPNCIECRVEEMLRQAADTEEELATLKGERNGILKANESLAKDNDRLRGENVKLKARLEAVIKIASESHISREVKHKGLRLYVCIDDLTTDLDMGEVVKSLNSIGSILHVARGEGGVE